MSTWGAIKSNWRVAVLVVLLLVSAVALFNPVAAMDGNGNPVNDAVNLDFGLELDGGSRIRAPVEGVTAEDVSFGDRSELDVERAVAGELGLDLGDVNARANEGTVEVLVGNVSQSELRSALSENGLSPGTVRGGVTGATRNEIIEVIKEKISAAGLSGGRVTQVTATDGRRYVVVEAPNMGTARLERMLSRRGVVRVVAHYPTDDGNYTNTTVLRQGDFADIDPATTEPLTRGGQPVDHVPVTLNQGAAERFSSVMRDAGFTGEGVASCNYPSPDGPDGYCLYTVVDEEVVYGAEMSRDLAGTIDKGDFANSPQFVLTTTSFDDAQELEINLRAGSLPAPLDVDAGVTSYIEPSLAEDFKVQSLVTGIVAVLAVSFVVFLRYGEARVALPMIVTAMSEVFLLLGVAAAVDLALDLSHIAGFIAVIGTGVDDLIIIADEVMSEGDVNSSRVFKSRFRKAFWVIGAAGATTIIAMSPLAVLSLGDLKGFAIITILGVLIGVLVTRPAYGDILRSLTTRH